MAETNFSKDDLQDILKNLLPSMMEATVRAAKAPNPVEEREIREQVEREKRRSAMLVHMSRAQEEADLRRKYGCTHSRIPAGGKGAGMPAPRGQGDWTTGGQTHGQGSNIPATLVCTRCATVWTFRPTDAELMAIEQNDGLRGFAPPAPERCLSQCCNSCNRMFTPGDFAQHDQENCQKHQTQQYHERMEKMRKMVG